MNAFALPRAVVDFEQHVFVAWNLKFLEQTGLTEDELKSSEAEELITFGQSWMPLSGANESRPVEYATCIAKPLSGANQVPGFAVRSNGKIGYVMLNSFDASAQFEQGRETGREEERNRVMKEFHDEVSSSIIAALFLIQTAKIELEDAGLPQAAAVSRASDILTETTEKIVEVLTAEKDQA